MPDFNSFGYEMDIRREHLERCRHGEDMFADIYSADKDDDLFGEIALIKAIRISGIRKTAKRLGRRANGKDFGGARSRNTRQRSTWYAERIARSSTRKNGRCGEDLVAECKNARCYIGIDLSSTLATDNGRF